MNAVNCLTIERMPEGGFVVADGIQRGGDYSRFCGQLFACADIGEALDFIRGKMAPPMKAPPMKAPADIGAIAGGIGAAVKI